jgi:hypothetical protein
VAAFYLDEDVPLRLARLLIDRGHFAVTTDDERRKGAPDARQLMYAAEHEWVLLTHNGDHYRLLHDAWLTWTDVWHVERRHAGIIVLPHVIATDLGRVADAIHQLVSDRGVSARGSLYERTAAGSWRRWPQ